MKYVRTEKETFLHDHKKIYWNKRNLWVFQTLQENNGCGRRMCCSSKILLEIIYFYCMIIRKDPFLLLMIRVFFMLKLLYLSLKRIIRFVARVLILYISRLEIFNIRINLLKILIWKNKAKTKVSSVSFIE